MIFLAGPPGCGKSTVAQGILKFLENYPGITATIVDGEETHEVTEGISLTRALGPIDD